MGVLLWIGAAAAQFTATPPIRQSSDPTLTAILTELKGLRADLTRSNQRLLAAQVLVGRVQMQEQRITYLDAQRTAGAAKLAYAANATRGTERRLAEIESGCRTLGNVGDEQRGVCEYELAALRSNLMPLREMEQQLRLANTELESALTSEQQRWSEFNERLDVLERSLAAGVAR